MTPAEKALAQVRDLFYPKPPRKPSREQFEDWKSFGEAMDAYELARKEDRAAVQAYQRSVSQIEETFSTDLAEFYGVADNPKAAKVFQMAWDRGHSSGYEEVGAIYGNLVELIQ